MSQKVVELIEQWLEVVGESPDSESPANKPAGENQEKTRSQIRQKEVIKKNNP